MNASPLQTSYIDHFIQADILERLARADGPLRFSELKEAGIENSLFMYHANKLLSRGIVEKNDDGFALTKKGAAWVNMTGTNAQQLPRPLVQLIVRCGDEILLGRRKGQLGSMLNTFLLPGVVHRYGVSSDDMGKELADEFFPDSGIEPVHTSSVEMIIRDDLTSHVLIELYSLSVSERSEPPERATVVYEWQAIDTVNSGNPIFADEHSLTSIIEKIRNNNLQSRELIELK